MLDKLRIQCKSLMELDKEKYEMIENILNNDNCFFEIDMNTAYAILRDLKVKEEDINKIYLELVKLENYEN